VRGLAGQTAIAVQQHPMLAHEGTNPMATILTGRKRYGAEAWVLAALLCALGWGARLGLAQNAASEKAEPAGRANLAQVDAARGAFDRFLDSHPELEDEVLGNPARLSDSNFLHEHPELQAFLESQPVVKADPRAFISPAVQWSRNRRRTDTEELLGWFIPFSVFISILLAVLWVLRVVLENRRWNKTFKVHEEVHTKLIEKFASGQELTAYMESDAGRRLLEWTPPAFDTPLRGLPVAASRILWSIQAGLILGLVGVGLLLIRDRIPDAVEPLLVFGTLGLTIGAGFILSALISYALSKHLGLMGGAAPGSALPSSR
jgi:hypothetical protein